MHPRARDRVGTMFDAPHLKLIGAIGYVDFVALQARSSAVVTDSGEVQEETTYIRVPYFTVRESGRSPLLKDTNPLLGLDVERSSRFRAYWTARLLPFRLRMAGTGGQASAPRRSSRRRSNTPPGRRATSGAQRRRRVLNAWQRGASTSFSESHAAEFPRRSSGHTDVDEGT
jgi:UDP-N-acetylglucosamine 2-epimerase